MAMVDPRRSEQVLGTLADMGVLLSIDDYGTGHSSLAYLQRLPVQRLKIDRSFVTGLVHDDATLLRLHRMGCFAVQGYGLGRPVPAALLPALVQSIEARVPGPLDRGAQVTAAVGP